MQRLDAPEILDSETCPAEEVRAALQTLDRINRCFGGVSTTQKMVERVLAAWGTRHFSLLEVAAGSGEVPRTVRQRLARKGIRMDVTLLDRVRSHLPQAKLPQAKPAERNASSSSARQDGGVVAEALALPFPDEAFDLVSCNLFAHHLSPEQLAQFVREGLRVGRKAVLINDLVRHPLHLALVYASYPIMGSRVAWLDGLTSVRRAYVPREIRSVACAASPHTKVEIIRNYLFRMGVIVWKRADLRG